MTRDWYKALVLVMWLALPINARNYWRAWDRLPARMAVHFDVKRQPNGYASKERAAGLGLGILATVLVLCTVAMLISRALHPSASWAVLIISGVMLGFIWYGNNSIIRFNLQEQASQSRVSERATIPPSWGRLDSPFDAPRLPRAGSESAAVSTRRRNLRHNGEGICLTAFQLWW